MKQIITLPDGSRIEIVGSNVKHICKDDNIMYDSTKRILYGEEQLDALKKSWKCDTSQKVKEELEKHRPIMEADIEE